MIIVFPMLCSSSLNPNILPGVGKVIEKYILVHELDRILEETQKSATSARVSKGRIEIKESGSYEPVNNKQFVSLTEDLISEVEADWDVSGSKAGGGGGGNNSKDVGSGKTKAAEAAQYAKEEKRKYEKAQEELTRKLQELEKERSKYTGSQAEKLDQEIEKVKSEIKKNEKQIEYWDHQMQKAKEEAEERKQKEKDLQGAVTGVTMHTEATSIEPTWMEVDRLMHGQRVKDLVGVKVVPFIVNSNQDQELVNMLLYDQNLQKLESTIVGLGRSIKRKMFGLYKSAIEHIPGISTGTITGDARHDVIMAKTSFKKNIFVCVDEMEFNDEFFQSAGGIKKLFKMGWPSIIALNDANRAGTFCMKPYKGICYKIPYSYMFRLLGEPSGKYYEDLTSVKKSSAGLFRKKTKPSKAFSENLVNSKLDSYKKVVQDSNNILTDEKIDQFILNESDGKKKEGWETVKKIRNLAKALTSGDEKKINSALKGKANLRELKQKGKQINPEFDKCFSIAKKNLKGVAPEANEKITEAFASLVGILSIRGQKDPVSFAKKMAGNASADIEKKLAKIRQSGEIKEKDSDKITGAVVFIVMVLLGIGAAAGIIYGLVTGSMSLYSSATSGTGTVGYHISIIGLIFHGVEDCLQIGWNAIAGTWNMISNVLAPFEKLLGPLWTEDGMKKFLQNPFWLFKPYRTLPTFSLADMMDL